ncbi:MAG: hypothetical protein ABIA37_02290 [Candidatus Woesearchaeota archaeon]
MKSNRQKLTVYRIDNGQQGLANTNAGNLLGVLNYLEYCDDRMIATGDYLSVFEIEFDGCFGVYVPMSGGHHRKGEKLEQCVGISEKHGSIWYSFPKQGRWKSRKIVSASLEDTFDYLKEGSVNLITTSLDVQAKKIGEYLDSLVLGLINFPYGC